MIRTICFGIFLSLTAMMGVSAQTPPANTTRCEKDTVRSRCMCPDKTHRTRILCGSHGGGFIADGVAAQAVEVRVSLNGSIQTKILPNPPNFYTGGIDKWAEGQLINEVARGANIIVGDYFYGNSVKLYDDERGSRELGSIGTLAGQSAPNSDRPDCDWQDEPNLIVYDPTSGGGSPTCGTRKALCRGRVTCRNRPAPSGHYHIAVCKALPGGKECPEASACAANDSEISL